MTPIVPRIAFFSIKKIKKTFRTSADYSWFAKGFEVFYFNKDIDPALLNKIGISAIVLIGNITPFKKIRSSSFLMIHAESEDDVTGDDIYREFIKFSCMDKNPKISIFTPTYNTFKKFERAYNSVISQTFSDWEWIILDDSPDEKNYEYINKLVKHDTRIKLYKANRQDSFVGSTKRQAASLCNGEYLVEFDHDDELHHLALEYIVDAFKRYPDAGFCYSDSCEVFEDGGNVVYGRGFALGHGIHYDTHYKGRHIVGSNTPINPNTMRHIVGIPNHFRCWKREVYNSIHRHNNKLYVVDDYEILIRTFLKTKIIHIPEILYIQYMNSGGNNTQEPRRAEIQRLVDWIQKYYDIKIHNRIIELGKNDWCWNDQTEQSDPRANPNKTRETMAYVYKV